MVTAMTYHQYNTKSSISRGSKVSNLNGSIQNALRSFSVDAIQGVELLDISSINMPEEELNAELGSGYGIFAGKDIQWAILKFNSDSAKWVSHEIWHPQQKTRIFEDGSYELAIPFSDEREILMDIMKYGQAAIVLEPKELRELVKRTLGLALKNY